MYVACTDVAVAQLLVVKQRGCGQNARLAGAGVEQTPAKVCLLRIPGGPILVVGRCMKHVGSPGREGLGVEAVDLHHGQDGSGYVLHVDSGVAVTPLDGELDQPVIELFGLDPRGIGSCHSD